MDNTHGAKSNKVVLNIAHVHMGMDAPEPGVASVFIDGVPIHAAHFIQITAAVGSTTKVNIIFEAEVTGQLGSENIEEMIRRTQEGEP